LTSANPHPLDYPKAVGEAFSGGKDEFQSGIMDVGKGKFATGLGKEAVGMLGMAFSPISAALDEFIGKPVSELTGSKAIGDRVADTAAVIARGQTRRGGSKVRTVARRNRTCA